MGLFSADTRVTGRPLQTILLTNNAEKTAIIVEIRINLPVMREYFARK